MHACCVPDRSVCLSVYLAVCLSLRHCVRGEIKNCDLCLQKDNLYQDKTLGLKFTGTKDSCSSVPEEMSYVVCLTSFDIISKKFRRGREHL